MDVTFALEMMGYDEFVRYSNADNDDTALDTSQGNHRLTDDEARGVIKEACGCDTADVLQCLSEQERIQNIKKLRNDGISIRQLSRLTGITKGMIEKYQDG